MPSQQSPSADQRLREIVNQRTPTEHREHAMAQIEAMTRSITGRTLSPEGTEGNTHPSSSQTPSNPTNGESWVDQQATEGCQRSPIDNARIIASSFRNALPTPAEGGELGSILYDTLQEPMNAPNMSAEERERALESLGVSGGDRVDSWIHFVSVWSSLFRNSDNPENNRSDNSR